MILVDTSAWVEFLRDTGSTACDRVEALLGGESAVCDVTDEDAVEELVESAWAALGSVDLVCANAGVIVAGSLLDVAGTATTYYTYADWCRFPNVLELRRAELVDEGGLESGQAILRQADQRCCDRLMGAALGRQSDAGRCGH